MPLTIMTLKQQFVKCNASRLAAFEALNKIMFIGTDCPPDFDREAFLQRQLYEVIRIATHAYLDEHAQVTPETIGLVITSVDPDLLLQNEKDPK